jgi:hypothetical protein
MRPVDLVNSRLGVRVPPPAPKPAGHRPAILACLSRGHSSAPDGMTAAAGSGRDQEAAQGPPGAGVRRARPLTGRKRWLSRQVDGQTKAAWREAKKVEAQLLEQLDRGDRRDGRSQTMGELVERWLEWRQQVRPISPVTVANYRGAIDRYITRTSAGPRSMRSTRPPSTPSMPACGPAAANAGSAGSASAGASRRCGPACATGPGQVPRRRCMSRTAPAAGRCRPRRSVRSTRCCRAPSSRPSCGAGPPTTRPGWRPHRPPAVPRWRRPTPKGWPGCSPRRWTRTRSWACSCAWPWCWAPAAAS